MNHTALYNRFFHLTLLLFLTLSLSSCFDDTDMEVVEIIRPDPKEIVTATVHGIVTDLDGNPIIDAEVKLHTEMGFVMLMTDDKGYFLFVDQRVQRSAFITAQKVRSNEGIPFASQRKVYIVENQVNYIQLSLPDVSITNSINANLGGRIEYENWLIFIPADALETDDGASYNGSAYASLSESRPEDEVFYSTLKGDLSGIDETGNVVALQSLGMLSIELFTAQNEPLRLKSGKTARLLLSPSAGLIKDPMEAIPLWYLNQETGTWLSQGVATPAGEGGFFEGNIQSLGVWNFDYKLDPINITGQLMLTLNGMSSPNNVGHLRIFIESLEFGKRGGFAAPNGKFNFLNYPKNEVFIFSVVDDCGNLIFDKQFGPFSSDQTLDNIEIDLNREQIDVIGSVQNCSGENIDKGLAIIQTINKEVFVNQFENGEFTIAFDKDCIPNEELLISFMDRETEEISEAYPFQITDENINLGAISFCPQVGEQLRYIVEGFDELMCTAPLINLQPSPMYSTFGCGNLLISVMNLNKVGVYKTGNKFSLTIGTDFYDHVNPEDFIINITEFGDGSGDIIAGTIVGQVRKVLGGGQFGPSLRITSSFNIIND